MSTIFDPYYLFIRIFIFINSSFLFIKILNLNANILKIKSKNKFLNYSKVINSFPFVKYKNETSFKKLVIVLPIDSKIYNKKLIYNTLYSILNLNYNYSLYLIYNSKCPKIYKKNIIYIKDYFNNIFVAFNLILNSINDYDYITFLTPGDLLKPTTYDFLYYIEDHDIYQIYEFNITSFNERKLFKEQDFFSNIKIYDFNNLMPNNNYVVYDKIYKVSLLKKYNIKFIIHQKSLYYFNLLAFSFAKDLLYINSYGIIHKIKVSTSKFVDNIFEEANILKKIISANKNITIKIIEQMNKIDYVFPYVTSNDPFWKRLYAISLSGKESKFEGGIQRFRDNGLLKFLFRSLEKYLPWINKVHMIVMCDSQVPNWLNREKVHIIYHSDFIPKKYLPTFSSSLIETFLPLLPLVEEKFIYGNDDLIPCRYLSKNFFFHGNIPCYNLNIRDYIETAPGDYVRRNAYSIITGNKENKRVATTQHSTVSYKMSLLKKCFQKYKKIILKSLSKFREKQNFNQYMYSFYQMMEDTILNIPHNIGLYYVKPKSVKSILKMNFKKYDYICLNDELEMTEKDWYKIQAKFEKLFPKKSKYEK